MEDFDAFPPVPVILDVGDDTLELTPIRVGEVPALLQVVRPFVGQLSVNPDWLALLAEHGESFLRAIAITSRRPTEWVAALAMDDAVRLATAVFEVNADFFVRRLAPVVQQAAERVNGRLGGATPSTASSGPGTASPTS